MSDNLPPAGWYPAPHANNEQRYWDGTQWLEPATAPTVAYPAAQATNADHDPASGEPAPKKSKKGWIIGGSVAAGIIMIAAIGGALGGNDKKDAPIAVETSTTAPAETIVEEQPVMVVMPDVVGMTASDARDAVSAVGLTPPAFTDASAVVLSTVPAAGSEAEEGTSVTFTLEEKPELTLGQENAISKAKSYISMMGFSRTGLIQQLEFEGYSTEDATFGADNSGADWNAECAEKAQSYIDMMAFSREGLYDQLAFEGFQPSEIEFGLAAVGY